MWLVPWVGALIGLFTVVVTVYDALTRRKRRQAIKKWEYGLGILAGLVFMWPVFLWIVVMLPRILLRR